MTPEGRTKIEIKKRLAKRGPRLKQFWPVQNGMGAATLDAHICYLSFYLIIEAKAPGEVPTTRQHSTLREYDEAQAEALVIDGTDYEPLEQALNKIEVAAAQLSGLR